MRTEFASRLSALLEGHGAKARLAKSVGCSRSTVSDWCLGNRNPTSVHIAAIATELDVSADWLLGIEDDHRTRRTRLVDDILRRHYERIRDELIREVCP